MKTSSKICLFATYLLLVMSSLIGLPPHYPGVPRGNVYAQKRSHQPGWYQYNRGGYSSFYQPYYVYGGRDQFGPRYYYNGYSYLGPRYYWNGYYYYGKPYANPYKPGITVQLKK